MLPEMAASLASCRAKSCVSVSLTFLLRLLPSLWLMTTWGKGEQGDAGGLGNWESLFQGTQSHRMRGSFLILLSFPPRLSPPSPPTLILTRPNKFISVLPCPGLCFEYAARRQRQRVTSPTTFTKTGQAAPFMWTERRKCEISIKKDAIRMPEEDKGAECHGAWWRRHTSSSAVYTAEPMASDTACQVPICPHAAL